MLPWTAQCTHNVSLTTFLHTPRIHVCRLQDAIDASTSLPRVRGHSGRRQSRLTSSLPANSLQVHVPRASRAPAARPLVPSESIVSLTSLAPHCISHPSIIATNAQDITSLPLPRLRSLTLALESTLPLSADDTARLIRAAPNLTALTLSDREIRDIPAANLRSVTSSPTALLTPQWAIWRCSAPCRVCRDCWGSPTTSLTSSPTAASCCRR